MNQISQYIFNLYHYLLNLRDTMEYVINRDHNLDTYNNRKNVIVKGKEEGSAFGNFIRDNKEQTAQLVEKLNEFINEFYSDESTIIMVSGDKVRVDHSQNIKILEATIALSESVRDVLFQYINFANSKKEMDAELMDMIIKDERLYRVIVEMLSLSEYEKSFGEFQKVMSESKGQPTPQSNFIVQNELSKLASLIRFSRAHCHCTDNPTLDMLDRAIQVIEMTEGRRDRRDNKNFKDLFSEINLEANNAVRDREPVWKSAFNKLLGEVVKNQKPADEPKA